ncbi:MAG: DUF1318 domain-containing protein [Deltaproteobacteria bacterium]
MKKIKGIIGILFLMLLSCAIITVNIYFPEKDVREAYKELEKELMTPGGQGTEPKSKPEGKPESSSRFELIASAHAQETGMADNIAQIVRKMPEVVSAYRDMGARLGNIDRLRDSGAVGEGNKGMLVIRDEKLMTPESRNLVTIENENRRTVMNGMARAIIRINRVPENDQNLKQVQPQAVEQFAGLRRDSAKKSWWIQDPNGNWARK